MQSLCSVNKLPPKNERKWHFGFTQRGFTMLCATTVIDQLLWYSSYYWFAPYLEKKVHSKIRTYASNFLIHPLYTIMRRQMLTNENIWDATKNLVTNYGFFSLFDGAFCEIARSVIYDLCGKTFDDLLKKYVLWKYDVYGIRNTLNLCKEYVEIPQRDNILCHGYIREFVEDNNYNANTKSDWLYVPSQIIDLIANDFYHDNKNDILDPKLNKFVNKLSKVNIKKDEINLKDEELQKKVKNLFENNKFQRLWKKKIFNEMQHKQQIASQQLTNGGYINNGYYDLQRTTINNRYNCYYFGCKSIVFYCDLCSTAIESKRMCRFKKCGHCLCSQCRRKFRIKRKCGICNKKWTRNENYYYLIPKIS